MINKTNLKLNIKTNIRSLMHYWGYDIVKCKKGGFPLDLDEETIRIIQYVRNFSMTSSERLFSLIQGVEYVVRNNIEGAIVECGVWRGGSMMAVALMLLNLRHYTKELYLYDVFESLMPIPTEKDITLDGKRFIELIGNNPKQYWKLVTLSEVQNNLKNTRYPIDKIHFIKGKVEDTLRTNYPKSISLLRLDTDWYESTKIELEVLYPRLSKGGILIIDDYMSHKGARKAVDEYFTGSDFTPFFNRIDTTGRLIIKPTE